MSSWPSFWRDLSEQMPLILTGLLNTIELAGLISVAAEC